MALLTRDAILALQQHPPPIRIDIVETPEWGDGQSIGVRTMTVVEAELYEQRHVQPLRRLFNALYTLGEIAEGEASRLQLEKLEIEDAEETLAHPKSSRVPLVVLCACDNDGTQLFTEADEEWLSTQSPSLIRRIYDAAWAINGFGTEALAAAKKNSVSSQNNGSGIVSPSNGVVRSGS